MPVASQSSVKGLCKAAVTLVSGLKSPTSSGGTEHREKPHSGCKGRYAPSSTPHRLPPPRTPTPIRRV